MPEDSQIEAFSERQNALQAIANADVGIQHECNKITYNPSPLVEPTLLDGPRPIEHRSIGPILF